MRNDKPHQRDQPIIPKVKLLLLSELFSNIRLLNDLYPLFLLLEGYLSGPGNDGNGQLPANQHHNVDRGQNQLGYYETTLPAVKCIDANIKTVK